MMSKILNAYKKGEWLCYTAILLQLVGILVINIKHIESGMGVFSYRVINLIAIFVLLAYIIIELIIFVIRLIKAKKEEGIRGYLKKNWIKVTILALLATISTAVSIVGICRYFSSRRNFNLDYNKTNFYFALASLCTGVYAVLKNKKEMKKDSLMSLIVLVPLALIICAGVQLDNYLFSIKFNQYLLSFYFVMLLFVLTLIHGRKITYISTFLFLIGNIALITGAVLGGRYNFSSSDLFEWTRFADVVALTLIGCYGGTMLIKTIYETDKISYKSKLATIILFAITLLITLLGVVFTIELKVSAPKDMHGLDKCYVLSIIATCIALVATYFRHGVKVDAIVFSSVVSVVAIVFSGVLLSKSQNASFAVFYKFSTISTSVILGFLLVTAVYYVVIKSLARTKRQKTEITSEVNEQKE